MNRDQFINLSLTELTFKELVALFRRRWAVVLGVTLLCLGVGAFASVMIPKTWRASTIIVVEGKTQSNPGNSNDIVGALTQTSTDYDVMTQIQIMSSFYVLYNALKQIGYEMPAQIDEETYRKMPKVSIQQIQTTNTVQISVEHTDDRTAVELAAALPQVYKNSVLEKQHEQVTRTLEFVTARIGEEQTNLANKLKEVSDYKAQNNVADVRTETEVRASAYAEAKRKLADAESDVRAAEAGLRSAEVERQRVPKMIDNPVSLTPSDTILRQQEIISNLKSQRDAALIRNQPDSDRVLAIDAQIKGAETYLQSVREMKQINSPSTVRNPLYDELEKSYTFSRASLQAAIAKRDSIRTEVDELRTSLSSFAPQMAKMQEMDSTAGEIASTITRLNQIRNDVQLRNSALQSPIDDVTGKTPPQLIRPIWSLNLALAGIVGLFLGCVFALVRDVSLDKVNTSSEASLITGREILGRIPLRPSVRNPLIADPQTARAFEAYRFLRNSILLSNGEKKVFLITSTLPKEGKTTVAANLAVAMALEGKRTILVDGNLRRPLVHKLFKTDRNKGVTEVLNGTSTLSECLKTTDVNNLAVLTAGAEANNPTELVASNGMKDLLGKLQDQCDIVIIDAPAAFGYADTQSLVSVAKDVLLVTELEAPTKPQLREATGIIEFAGGQIIGLILNKDKWAIQRTRASA